MSTNSITRDGSHGVNVGAAELFFALVNAHGWILYEIWANGAREIKPKKRFFGSLERIILEILQATSSKRLQLF